MREENNFSNYKEKVIKLAYGNIARLERIIASKTDGKELKRWMDLQKRSKANLEKILEGF